MDSRHVAIAEEDRQEAEDIARALGVVPGVGAAQHQIGGDENLLGWEHLPESATDEPERRAKVGVPQDMEFRTKPELALEAIRAALADWVEPGVVLADAGYGNSSGFRDDLSSLGLGYVVQVQADLTAWPPGASPAVPEWDGRGRSPTRLRGAGGEVARGVDKLAALRPGVGPSRSRMKSFDGSSRLARGARGR